MRRQAFRIPALAAAILAAALCAAPRADEPPDSPRVEILHVPRADLSRAPGFDPQGAFLPLDELLDLTRRARLEREKPAEAAGPWMATALALEGAFEGDAVALTGRLDFRAPADGWSAAPIHDGSALAWLEQEQEGEGAAARLARVDGAVWLVAKGPGAGSLRVKAAAPAKIAGRDGELSLGRFLAPARVEFAPRADLRLASSTAPAVEEPGAEDGRRRVVAWPAADGQAASFKFRREPSLRFEAPLTLRHRRIVAPYQGGVEAVDHLGFSGRFSAGESLSFPLPGGMRYLGAAPNEKALVHAADGKLVVAPLEDETSLDVSVRFQAELSGGEATLGAWEIPAASVESTLVFRDWEEKTVAPLELPAGLAPAPKRDRESRAYAAWGPLPATRVAAAPIQSAESPSIASSLVAMRGEASLVWSATYERANPGELVFEAPEGWTLTGVSVESNYSAAPAELTRGEGGCWSARWDAKLAPPTRVAATLRRSGDWGAPGQRSELAAPFLRLASGPPAASRHMRVSWPEEIEARAIDLVDVAVAPNDRPSRLAEVERCAMENFALAGLAPEYGQVQQMAVSNSYQMLNSQRQSQARQFVQNDFAPPTFPRATSILLRATGESPAAAIALNGRESDARAEIMLALSIGDDRAEARARVDYNVRFSPRGAFRFALPKGTGRDVKIDAPSLRESTMVETEDADVWTVAIQEPALGSIPVSLEWTLDAKPGEEAILAPEVKALDVSSQRGHIALEGSASLALEVETRNLAEIELFELPPSPWPRERRALAAYRYIAPPYTLKVTARKFRHEDAPEGYAREADISTAVLPEGGRLTLAEYRYAPTSDRQFMEVELPAGARLWSALVNGRGEKPARRLRPDGASVLLLPLPARGEGEGDVLASLLYREDAPPLASVDSVELDGPTLNVPTHKTRWTLHLPSQFEYLRFGGAMGGDKPEAEPAIAALRHAKWPKLLALDGLSFGAAAIFVAAVGMLAGSRSLFLRRAARARAAGRSAGAAAIASVVELVLVAAAALVAATIVAPNLASSQRQAKVDAAYRELATLSAALGAYRADNGAYPADLVALSIGSVQYLPAPPRDPFSPDGREALRYRSGDEAFESMRATGDATRYGSAGEFWVAYSVGPDGVDQGGAGRVVGAGSDAGDIAAFAPGYAGPRSNFGGYGVRRRDQPEALATLAATLAAALASGAAVLLLWWRDRRRAPRSTEVGRSFLARWLGTLVVASIVLLFMLMIFIRLGKRVQGQVGASMQKLVGSVEHDAALDDYGVDARVPSPRKAPAAAPAIGGENAAPEPWAAAPEDMKEAKPGRLGLRDEAEKQSSGSDRSRQQGYYEDGDEEAPARELGRLDSNAPASVASPFGAPTQSAASPFLGAQAGQPIVSGSASGFGGGGTFTLDAAANRAQAVGLLSLQIALPEGATQRTFESLDGDANVRVRLMDRRAFVRAERLAWIATFIILGWLSLASTRAYRAALVAVVAIAALLPIAWPGDYVAFFNAALLGALLSVAVPAGRSLSRRWDDSADEASETSRRSPQGAAKAAVSAAILALFASANASASEPPAAEEPIRLVAPYDRASDLAADPSERRAFIARAAFERLWDAARRDPLPANERGAFLAQALLDAALDPETSTANGELRLDAANPGSTSALVPISFGELALGAATSDPLGATIEAAPGGGLALRLPPRWAGRVSAPFAAPARLEGSAGSLSITFPTAGSGRWRVALPWTSVEAAGASSLLVERSADGATLLGEARQGENRISWRGAASSTRFGVGAAYRTTIDNRLRWNNLASAEWSAVATLEAEGNGTLPREVAFALDPGLAVVDARGEELESASIDNGVLTLRFAEGGRAVAAITGFAARPVGGDAWTAPGLRLADGSRADGAVSIEIATSIEIVSMEADGLRRQGNGETDASVRRAGAPDGFARRAYAVDAADWSVSLKLRRASPEFDAVVEELFAPASGAFLRASTVSLRTVGAAAPREAALSLPEGLRVREVALDGAAAPWVALNGRLLVDLSGAVAGAGDMRLRIVAEGESASRGGAGSFAFAPIEVEGARRVERVAAAWVPGDFEARVADASRAKSSTPTPRLEELAGLIAPSLPDDAGLIAAWSLPDDGAPFELLLDPVAASAFASAWSLAAFAEGRKTLDATLLVEPRRGRVSTVQARVLLAEPDPGAAARVVVTGPIRSSRAEQASDRELLLEIEFDAPRSAPALVRATLEQPAETSGAEPVGPALLLPVGEGASGAWLVARRDFAGNLAPSRLSGAKAVDVAEARWPAGSGFAPQPSDLAYELPANIAEPPRFSISRHARDESLRAIVDAMRLRVVLTDDGVERHELEIAMQNQSEQFLRVKLPYPSAQVGVVEALVGGEPSKWSFINEGGDEFLAVPLIRTGLLDPELSIRLAYVVETRSPLRRSGQGRFEMPEIGGGVPVSETSLILMMPEEYSFSRFDGTLDKVELVDLDAAELVRRAKSAEKLSEAALRSSGATQAAALGKLAELNDELVVFSKTARQNVEAHERQVGKKMQGADKQTQEREQNLNRERYKALEQAELSYSNFADNNDFIIEQVERAPAQQSMQLQQQAITIQPGDPFVVAPEPEPKRAAPLQFPREGQSFAFRQLQGAGHVTFHYVAVDRRGAQYDLLIGAGVVGLAALFAFGGGWLLASRRRLALLVAAGSIAALSFGALLDVAIPALAIAIWLAATGRKKAA